MKVGRASPAVAAADSLLYVIGGDQTYEVNFYNAQTTIAEVECYDPLTNNWSDCPPLPESRSEAGAVVIWSRSHQHLIDVLRLNPKTHYSTSDQRW